MRVIPGQLLTVLDPDASLRRKTGIRLPSPLGSARSTSSRAAELPGSEFEADELSAFDLLHTEQGFNNFEKWYKHLLPPETKEAERIPLELGPLWPSLYCPPWGLPEHAFAEIIHAFAICTDAEVNDLFDLLDLELQGFLSFKEVYTGICLLAALGCKQLRKFLYLHSRRVFEMLAVGDQTSDSSELVAWPRILALVRSLGAPIHVISKAGIGSRDGRPMELEHWTHDQFLQAVYIVAEHLDKGPRIERPPPRSSA